MRRQFGQFSLTVPKQSIHITNSITAWHRTWDNKAKPAVGQQQGCWRPLCESRSVSFASAAPRPTTTPLQVTAKPEGNWYPRSSEQHTAETSALPQHSITSKVPVPARKHRSDSSGSARTSGEHLVDVFESAGLVHFSGEISAPRARARRIWRGLEGSGRGG